MPLSVAHSQTPPPIPRSVPASFPAMGRARARAYSGDAERIEERLFELRREAIALSNQHDPVARVAALLISIAQTNRYEGRDPLTVPQSLSCGFVADLLGMSVDALAHVLTQMEARGLIEPGGSSTLRIKDVDALSALAGAA